MKTISILFTFLYISALFSQAPNCVNDSTGYIPLNDMGTGNFFGYQGGLYPGGTNTIPNLHLKAGKKLANQIRPRNMAGAVDLENGKVVLLCLGSSVAGSTFEKFTDLY
ncbi:MAG: hypothetical protein H7X71_01275, partial [Chitinophagales bacterium]|nr:hypothetical protein [Chitinophagales bacterium]